MRILKKTSPGNFSIYFRMSIESFDKLLVLVGARITYKKNSTTPVCVTTRETGSNIYLLTYLLTYSLHGAESFLSS